MARFAPIKVDKSHQDIQPKAYEHGYHTDTDTYTHISQPGLSKKTIEEISSHKSEPAWMRQERLIGYNKFQSKPTPTWGGDLGQINYDAIHYYLKPTDQQVQSWADVPEDIKTTFDRIGVPEAERKALSGVKAQYDSEVVYGSLKTFLKDKGVIFLSMDEAVVSHFDLVKEYFGTVIPSGDNKFAALNTAVWSGGSFVYVPKGVKVDLPLQAYFRINAPNAGQFERTLIIADEGSSVHYIEGCFVQETKINTSQGRVNIEDITDNDQVLTHQGKYKPVYHTQVRPYSGDLYTITVTGNPSEPITTTEEHPFLVVKRQLKKERNYLWNPEWISAKHLSKNDYLCTPIDKTLNSTKSISLTILEGKGRHGFKPVKVTFPSSPELFRLIGYYLAEGSISGGHYLNFSFGSHEREYIEDVKKLLRRVFDEDKFHESHHLNNQGTSVVVRSTRLCRIFSQLAGVGCQGKFISNILMHEDTQKQKQLILGWFRGDGNYH